MSGSNVRSSLLSGIGAFGSHTDLALTAGGGAGATSADIRLQVSTAFSVDAVGLAGGANAHALAVGASGTSGTGLAAFAAVTVGGVEVSAGQ